MKEDKQTPGLRSQIDALLKTKEVDDIVKRIGVTAYIKSGHFSEWLKNNLKFQPSTSVYSLTEQMLSDYTESLKRQHDGKK